MTIDLGKLAEATRWLTAAVSRKREPVRANDLDRERYSIGSGIR
jgi:hypothetical protein